ncbi:MAG: DUF177 domain-containing protein [Peptococcaceae bacterium]|nr:DUF177 domain-containing protein [Peptococcaceae bacterium]
MALDLDISRVRSVKGSSERYHLEVSEFDLEDENWSLAKPLVIDAEISHEKQFLQMNGKLATAVKGVCSRCLKPVETPVECSFAEQLLYAKDISLFSHLAVGEVEEKYFIYDNDTLDITDIVRESILAELPLKILCVEDCRGLCPKCGKNLNQGQCDCDLHEVDPRLAILATLMED